MPTSHHDTRDSAGTPQPRRRIGLLAAVFVAAAIAVGALILLATMDSGGVAGFERSEGPLVAELQDRLDTVGGIEIDSVGQRITLEADAQGWQLVEAGGYPAQTAAVENLLAELAGLQAAYVSEPGTDDHQRYGVGEPGTAAGYGTGTAVTVRDRAGGTIIRLILGPPFSTPGEPGASMIFVRTGDDPRIWLASGTPQISSDPLHWVDREIVHVPRASVLAVATAAPDGHELVIERSEDGTLTVAEGLGPETQLRGPWVLDTVASLLEQIRFEAVRPLDEAAVPTQTWQARVATDQWIAYEIRLLDRVADGHWGTIAARAEEDGAAQAAERFNERHARWAYLLPVYTTERMTTRPEDLAQ